MDHAQETQTPEVKSKITNITPTQLEIYYHKNVHTVSKFFMRKLSEIFNKFYLYLLRKNVIFNFTQYQEVTTGQEVAYYQVTFNIKQNCISTLDVYQTDKEGNIIKQPKEEIKEPEWFFPWME